MNDTSKNNSDNQEIDLSQVSKKIGQFFENISTSIFRGFLFLKRNLIIISILFIIGVALGFYLDKTNKEFENKLYVQPNFGSVDYLYSKIELIESKIKDNDTLFLKNVVGVKDAKKLKEITIEPISDVYKFVKENPQNFELIKLMAEDGDISKVFSDNITSKNYPYHLISFITLKETDFDKTVNPILKYLNDSEFYSKIQKQYIDNISIKIIENDSIINQINSFLNTFSNTVNGSQKSDKLVYYNENSQLNDVIKTKDDLVREQGIHRIELINLNKIIKNSAEVLNIKYTESINGKLKFILPLILVALFILGGLIKAYYKRQMAKLNT
ncbi:hypothetical protein [Flavobacterium sp.]|uniref:hypothetical protein n=1 Tax=Flavobacterium sp. TaxID=239 RepID=UPI002B6B80D8|nr:hypothetical protein [Flavobacterium sp.]HQA74772.1 hypothetical protein [Flavobacterium sp.]